MKRALFLAKRGMGKVSPNPLVGAVLVKKNKVIGEGAHLAFGGPHAEVHAIRNAKADPKGATLYVTLEPCAHQGKTPACTDLILEKKIKKVIIADRDSNPLVSGKGIRVLKRAGVRVMAGVLEAEALELNKAYHYWVRKKKPYVIVKVAQSVDGKIVTKPGQSRWISGLPARKISHALRASSQAVLVGVNTVIKDDPRLSVRHLKSVAQPAKVVLDSRLRTSPAAQLFSKRSKASVILAVTKKAPESRRRRFINRAEIWVIKEKNGRVDLKEVLKRLGRRGVCQVLIEGGAEVIADAIARHLVNEVCLFIAPKIAGGRRTLGLIKDSGISFLGEVSRLRHIKVQLVGRDLLIQGVF